MANTSQLSTACFERRTQRIKVNPISVVYARGYGSSTKCDAAQSQYERCLKYGVVCPASPQKGSISRRLKSRRSSRKVKEASCIILCQRPLEPILQKLQMAINLLQQQDNYQGPADVAFTDL